MWCHSRTVGHIKHNFKEDLLLTGNNFSKNTRQTQPTGLAIDESKGL